MRLLRLQHLLRRPIHHKAPHIEHEHAVAHVGIFESLDGGATWSTTNRGSANVSVDELVFMHNSNTLLAATHGRGLFTAYVAVPLPGDLSCDGRVDFGDINPFVALLSGGG